MPRILHLSDLHFGAHDPIIVEALEARLDREQADLVVVSGDFTQRAKTEQFQQACEFMAGDAQKFERHGEQWELSDTGEAVEEAPAT